MLAIVLWATDFLHHMHPALIAIGVGLLLTLPKVGVLDAAAIKSVNLPLILFLGGALSLSKALVATHALTPVTDGLVDWIAPLLTEPWTGTLTLYWGGFFYQFLAAHPFVMLSTGLPVFLDIAMLKGLNPIAVGLVWFFASASRLYIYQAAFFVLAFSYGYFRAMALVKVGGVLALVGGVLIVLLVPLYWPLVGLSWNLEPAEPDAIALQTEVASAQIAANRPAEAGRSGDDITSAMVNTHLSADGFNAETTAWASIRDSSARQDFVEFLKAFPQTRFAFAARMRLRQFLEGP